MRTNVKTFLSTAAVVAALAGGPSMSAYAEIPKQGSGGMLQGGQGGMMGMMGMMNMMQQMSQMMETCNNMIARHHGPETPKDKETPDKAG